MSILFRAAVSVTAFVSVECIAPNTPLSWNSVAQAQNLSSSLQFKVNKLAKNILNARKSLASQGNAAIVDDFKARQWQQRIDSFANGLKLYPANTDPAFATAAAQLAELQKEFAALKAGDNAAAPAQPSTENQAATAAPAPTGAQLDNSGRIKINALINNIERTTKLIESKGVAELQTPEGIAKYKKAVADHAQALGQFKDFQGDPNVRKAVLTYKTMTETLQATYAESQKSKSTGDGVQAELAALDKIMAGNKAPKSLLAPFTETEAKAWVDRINQVIANGDKIKAEVNRIGSSNPLPIVKGTVSQGTPYDKQDIQRMWSWSDKQIRDANEAVVVTERNLDSQFNFQDKKFELGYFRSLDPNNQKDMANAFLKDGAEQEIYSRLDRQLAMAESFAAYEKAKIGAVSDAKQARVDEVIALRKRYGEQRIEALGASKMPKPASDDAKRLEIAKTLLATPRYEFGEHGPIVLTSANIDTRTKTVTRDTIKDVDVSLSGDITWSGTRETWNYDWDEFYYATPIKEENGEWYIWWNKATFYRSGASTTPLNKWISGGATQGNLILEENFR